MRNVSYRHALVPRRISAPSAPARIPATTVVSLGDGLDEPALAGGG